MCWEFSLMQGKMRIKGNIMKIFHKAQGIFTSFSWPTSSYMDAIPASFTRSHLLLSGSYSFTTSLTVLSFTCSICTALFIPQKCMAFSWPSTVLCLESSPWNITWLAFHHSRFKFKCYLFRQAVLSNHPFRMTLFSFPSKFLSLNFFFLQTIYH